MADKIETKPGDMTYVDAHGTVHISRSIPLPWLIGAIFAIAGQAGTLWLGQRDNAKTLDELTKSTKDMASAVSSATISIMKHDMQIDDLRSRVIIMESEQKNGARSVK